MTHIAPTGLRLGLRRADRPLAVVAIAEARVLQHELERRLGTIGLDLRLDGDPLGGWQPIANAAWPTDIDAELDAATIWGSTPLTALFARTVEPAAAAVRRRMLTHLGLLPAGDFDQETLRSLSALPIRPTDLWLMVTAAERVDVDDPAVAAFAAPAGGPEQTALDAMFDRVAADAAATDVSFDRVVERARAREADWQRRATETADELVRSQLEAAERLDELESENRVLRDRVERLQLEARRWRER